MYTIVIRSRQRIAETLPSFRAYDLSLSGMRRFLDRKKGRSGGQLSTFRMNTCKSVSKQRTLTLFRMNTYAKTGGRGTPAINVRDAPGRTHSATGGACSLPSLIRRGGSLPCCEAFSERGQNPCPSFLVLAPHLVVRHTRVAQCDFRLVSARLQSDRHNRLRALRCFRHPGVLQQ